MTQTKKFSIKDFFIDYNTYIIFVVLFIACSVLSSTFLTPNNLMNIVLQQTGPIMVALGMLFVIITAGIDISVNAVPALTSCVAYVLIRDHGCSFWVGMIAAIVVGILFGMLNGILVAYFGMQGFVATLATYSVGQGFALIVSAGAPVRCSDNAIVKAMASKDAGYPIVIATIIIVILLALVQHYTAYGRIVIACGSNPTAVRLAGINVKKYICSAYIVSGVLSAIGGLFLASRTQTAASTLGATGANDAIAACVIGGASLAGGKGTVFRTIIGAFVIALISNIMNLMGVPAYPQEIVKGFIIIAAVLLQIATDRTDQSV